MTRESPTGTEHTDDHGTSAARRIGRPADDAGAATEEHHAADGEEHARASSPTLLEQMGGVAGMVYSAIPVIVFVVVNALSSLTPAIWAAVGSAVLIMVIRLVRRERVQPAISSVFGVAIAAFIAYRTGSAKGYFAYGIWVSVLFGAAFLVSVVARWPLAGVAWSVLNGTNMRWRRDKRARRYYDVATLVWVLVFGARFVVQQYLYQQNQVGWLAAARIGMGLPLAAVAALVTIWAVHKADKRMKDLEPAETHAAETAHAGETTGEPTTTAAEATMPIRHDRAR